MECSISKPALSLLKKTSSYWSALKAPNFSAIHWSQHSSLVSIGQNYVTTRVVHLPKMTEKSLLPNRTQSNLITGYCIYARPAQPSPIRTRLCGPYIAALAGFRLLWVVDIMFYSFTLAD